MTKNSFGVKAKINAGAFNDWRDYGSTGNTIKALQIDAARTVLHVIADRGHFGIFSGTEGCFIKMVLGDYMGEILGELSIPFGTLIDEWIEFCVADEAAPALIAALEYALAKIRALS